jgi:hypothetical protein
LIGVALEHLGKRPDDIRGLGPEGAGGTLKVHERLKLQRFLATVRSVTLPYDNANILIAFDFQSAGSR